MKLNILDDFPHSPKPVSCECEHSRCVPEGNWLYRFTKNPDGSEVLFKAAFGLSQMQCERFREVFLKFFAQIN